MAPSRYPFVVLDVFTSTPFTGNQLALVQLPNTEALTREQRHAIAREFNFSETVFLYDQYKGQGADEARKVEIWTPFAELPFAGKPFFLCHTAITPLESCLANGTRRKGASRSSGLDPVYASQREGEESRLSWSRVVTLGFMIDQSIIASSARGDQLMKAHLSVATNEVHSLQWGSFLIEGDSW